MVSFSPGGNFVPPTGLKYCNDYTLNFSPGAKSKFTEMPKHSRCACSRSFFRRGWKNDSEYMDFSARLPGLKRSPRNRYFHFKRIYFRTRAEVSTRLTGLKFKPRLKFATWSGPMTGIREFKQLRWQQQRSGEKVLTGLRDSCHSQAIRKSMPSKFSSDQDVF